MADPLSIVGTAAGLVSLGLQLYGGIKDYLDAIQSRQEDLASIHRHATALKNALGAIEAGIQSRSVTNQTSAPAAISCLQSCGAELNALSAVLAEITPSSSALGPNTFRLKLKEEKMKLTYPFKRSNISKLEERLQNANLTLHTALHALGINLLATLNDTVSDYKVQSDTLAAGIISLRSESIGINSSIHAISGSLPAVMDGVQALGPLIKTESTKISSQMHQDGQVLRQNISHLENQMDASFLSQKSQLERIESHIAHRFQEDERLRRLEEILVSMELADLLGRQHDSTTRYLGRLVAKPDNLKFMCDEFTSREPVREPYSPRTIQADNFALQSRKRIQSGCSCGAVRGHKRRYNRWGPLLLYQDEDGGATHLRDCKYSGFNVPESSRKIGATYFGSGSLLRRAIGFTFSMKHGAGGASMSANLVCYNVVNDKTAPVFRLMKELDRALKQGESSLRASDVGRLFEECSSKIRHLYQAGKAGPEDLTPRGESVLHKASFLVRLLRDYCPATLESLRYFITDLLSYGVLVGICDRDGRTPLVNGLAFVRDDAHLLECAEIYELLFSKGSDLPISHYKQAHQLLAYSSIGDLGALLRISLPAAEVLGCNSLAIAVLQRNARETKRLVEMDPSLSHERNTFHMTPIHLASKWPDGLKILLSRSSLPARVKGWPTPLITSTKNSALLCEEGNNPVLCSTCSCFESAEIILSYDCSICDISEAVCSASHRTKLKLFEHLKDRRVRLREFCLQKLPEENAKLLGLHSNQIPDSKANAVVELLQQKGIEIPQPLRIGIERDLATPTNSYYWGSVYHTIDCPATADILLALGFTDLDSEDNCGETPLSGASSPDYALWLIDHGADITAPSANTLGSKLNQTTAHGVAYEFGLYLFPYPRLSKDWRKIDLESRNRLLSLICNSDGPDNCRCTCSTQGCTPFIFLLKEAWYSWSDFSSSAVGFKKTLKAFTKPYNVFPQEVLEKPRISLELLRYITFTALEIRHTCCYGYCALRGPHFGKVYDEEDLEEFREEDSPLVELLEELMEEFETEYEVSDENFIDFLEGYWRDRMDEVLMEMEESKMTDEQKRSLEEIGVNLYEEAEEVPQVMQEKVQEKRDLSYWIKRMDEIVTL